MAIERPRLCGFRKVGALYLCGEGRSAHCDRLPYKLDVCPVCGAGVKLSRGFQWLDWEEYAGDHGSGCSCPITSPFTCPICHPEVQHQPYCLLWVGESYYTMEEFAAEARLLGISKRIPQVPRNLKLGVTWTILAHPYACGSKQELNENGILKTVGIPGIFYVFKPARVEMLIWKSDATAEKIEELRKRHITPIIVPDDDTDHDPETKLIPSEKVATEAKNAAFFENLRSKLRP